MDISGYIYTETGPGCAHSYLLPVVLSTLAKEEVKGLPKRIFELGCGNGIVANELHRRGYEVAGVDPSTEGIKMANQAFPNLKLASGSSDEDLAARFGTFSIVLSLEVIEHVYAPRQFAARVFDLLEPGGLAIISTPYHGYLKNVALAVTGKLDQHFTALWDHGHIKFWSFRTLRRLLGEAGFRHISLRRAGRIPVLAKSMVAIARK